MPQMDVKPPHQEMQTTAAHAEMHAQTPMGHVGNKTALQAVAAAQSTILDNIPDVWAAQAA
jgi:hypothetical protein